ncbi:hypothetical protein ACO0RG_001133 [Hanseniaspora osmophila]
MPVNIIGSLIIDGPDAIPYYEQITKVLPYATGIGVVKYLFKGRKNTWERNLHGKVYIVTGATSNGMGTSVVLDLAKRGAQLIMLTRRVDEWTTQFVEDLRESTQNELIYLEQCDMSDLYSVRKFATTWLDNTPPRRLDGVVLMHGDAEPWFQNDKRKSSQDGVELQLATNFAGPFHLLNLLLPSFRSQPPDRDVRIIYTTCISQAFGSVNLDDPLLEKKQLNARQFFGTAKLQMSLCCLELQRKITSEKKDDAGSVTVSLVQPGLMRSSSLRTILSNGSPILLLLLYCIILYPLLWLFVKNGHQGAQNILYTLMTPELEKVNLLDYSVKYVVNCTIMKNFARKEFADQELQKKLYEKMESEILGIEKKSAFRRNKAKASGSTKEAASTSRTKSANNTSSSKPAKRKSKKA